MAEGEIGFKHLRLSEGGSERIREAQRHERMGQVSGLQYSSNSNQRRLEVEVVGRVVSRMPGLDVGRVED